MTVPSGAIDGFKANEGSWLSRLTGTQAVLGAVALIHILMFVYDEYTGFQAFAWGDRGVERLSVFKSFAQLGDIPLLRAVIDSPVVPGEYLFTIWPWLAFGPAGVVALQILLALVACWMTMKIADQVVPWKAAAPICGLIYALLPQSLAFPHQLVTEAIATPLTVAWLYFMMSAFRSRRLATFIAAGICIGLAIFIRPSTLLMLPITFALALLYAPARSELFRPGLYVMGILGAAPLLIWAAVFTWQTGHFGYNKGIANLGWNLRNKALITERANGLPPPPDLLVPEGGISVGRFFEEAGRHKLPFAKAFLLDAVAVFGRGNSTKMAIDYFGIGRDQKEWRQELLYDQDPGQGRLMRLLKPIVVIEALTSLMTVLFSAFCVWQAGRIGWTLLRGSRDLPQHVVWMTVLTTALMLNVFASAQMVDQAQGRLRNPAEAAMIIFGVMALTTRKEAAASAKVKQIAA